MPGSTLNSIAAPQLITALVQILSVINGNIDKTNLASSVSAPLLSVMSKSANYVASNGERVIVTSGAPLTITAPVPIVNGRFAVYAEFSMSGTSPVTIQAASGTPLFFLGSNGLGVASLLLGSQGAHAEFASDGINWYLVSGQQDTGWVPLTLATGVASYSSAAITPGARLRGDALQLKGWLANTSGADISGGSTLATLPVALRPTSQLQSFPGTPTKGSQGILTVATSGAISVNNTIEEVRGLRSV